MNFKYIVINGYVTEYDRNHLVEYFYREYKKAEKEYYDADECFDGFLSVIDEIKTYFHNVYVDHYKNLRHRLSDAEQILEIINEAKYRALHINEVEEDEEEIGEAEEEQKPDYYKINSEIAEECRKEFKYLNANNFSIESTDFLPICCRYTINLKVIFKLEDAIYEGYKRSTGKDKLSKLRKFVFCYPEWIRQFEEENNVSIKPFPPTLINSQLLEGNSHKVQKNKSPEDSEKESEIRAFIKQRVESIDPDLKWEYVFFNSNDYELFTDCMTNYFMDRTFKWPKLINLKQGCKTRFVPFFNTIHKKFKLRTPNLKKYSGYYEFLKIFDVFKDLDNSNIYDDITKRGEKV